MLRDGEETSVDPDALVRGDIVVLRRGDQVPADGTVVAGSGAIDESLLTGESEPMLRTSGDRALSGTFITEGTLFVELEKVGDESYAAGLTREGRAIRSPKSQLMQDLNKLLHYVSMILVPLGLLVLLKQTLFNGIALKAAVPAAVASMLGMIPEGLILLTSVALMVGVVRLGRKDVLVQELYGIETLARADVLCLDKTGTLTTGRMEVETVLPVNTSEDALRADLSRFLAAFDDATGTLDALRAWCPPAADTTDIVSAEPFSSEKKCSAVILRDGRRIVLGAPSFVMENLPAPLQEQQNALTAQGLRVLLLAGSVQGGTLSPMALLALRDELRPGCAATLEAFRHEGVQLKLISGDDPRTVSAIAKRLGLDGEWVDASVLDADALKQRCKQTTVFGRVSPEQKRLLVEALKGHGLRVAMTGDGVNDIPALKAADCSIAVAGGSDAARHAAQISIPGDGFPLLPQVVSEGRRVVGNITRASSLFLVKTLSTFLISLVTLLLPLAYPFQPVQLTLISALTLGIPSFFLAMEPNQERIEGSFLARVLRRAVPGGSAVAVAALLCMAGEYWIGLPTEMCSVLASLCALGVGLLALYSVCVPVSKLRIAVASLMTIGSLIAVAVLGDLFKVSTGILTGAAWGYGLLCLAAGTGVWVAASLLFRRKRTSANTH